MKCSVLHCLAALAMLAVGRSSVVACPTPGPVAGMTDEQVVAFARLALKGIDREYPNKPSNVMVGPESVQSPKEMHPAFYGCFDWHSSGHGVCFQRSLRR